jgi:hypothetical protein
MSARQRTMWCCNTDLSQRTEEQAASLEETASSMEAFNVISYHILVQPSDKAEIVWPTVTRSALF